MLTCLDLLQCATVSSLGISLKRQENVILQTRPFFMLSSHIRDFLEDCVETYYDKKNRIESYYDSELSLKSVRQKNSGRPQQNGNQRLSRSWKDVRTIFIGV